MVKVDVFPAVEDHGAESEVGIVERILEQAGELDNVAGVLVSGVVVGDDEGGTAAFAQEAMLGDVNRDGECNVLDIQNTINQALGLATQTREANLDENGQVDVIDVQNMVNTVLCTGGLVQRIKGQIQLQEQRDRFRCNFTPY